MKRLLFILFCVVLGACNNPLRFTQQEKELINSGDSSQVMRVLLITDTNDSVFLRQPCVDIEVDTGDNDLQLLIKRMRITMDEGGGIGIAANQVGVGRNLFLITRLDKPNHPVEVLINPQVIAYSKDTVAFYGDGCLSVPNLWGVTERSKSVKVKYYNEQGKVIEEEITGYTRPNNFTAIIFQHEFDHLRGVLFTDRIHNNELYTID